MKTNDKRIKFDLGNGVAPGGQRIILGLTRWESKRLPTRSNDSVKSVTFTTGIRTNAVPSPFSTYTFRPIYTDGASKNIQTFKGLENFK